MAKIKFKRITYKNFLSAGDNPITIDLDKTKTTLVVGENGTGKSSGLLDGISFALFGRAHRKINKPQLINSINNKRCLVELDFDIGPTKYTIRRGMKPNIFELYQNGKMLNQEAHAQDYQKILESNILKMGHKAFHQIVVLGNSNFTPFMQLPAYNRRAVIEDLLDIHVFSRMGTIIKGRISNLKLELSDAAHNTKLITEKIALQSKHISDLKTIDQDYVKQIEDETSELVSQVKSLNDYNDKLFKEIDDMPTSGDMLDEVNTKIAEMSHTIDRSVREHKRIEKEIDFYQDTDVCPTCNQNIGDDHKTTAVTDLKRLGDEIKEEGELTLTKLKSIRESQAQIKEDLKAIAKINTTITANNASIASLTKAIEKNKERMQQDSSIDTTDAEKVLSELHESLNKLKKHTAQVKKVYSYCAFIDEVLRDNGIKSKVIKQYLPVMNQLINQYLQVLDFFVSFHIDENFDETIKSRHRDVFSYSSFSEGERTRIDLALIFTWRQIAKMKNSVSTNLLVMDEICDSSLDSVGVENLIKIINASDKNNNVFIISHKTELTEESSKFDRTLEFKKEGNFSTMSEH